MKKIFIIAGEASGELFGANFIRSIKKLSKNIKFLGVGGERMKSEGFRSIFPMKELSVFGFLEVLPVIFKLKKRIDQTINKILKEKPDLVLTIDSPGFNYRVAKGLRANNYKGKIHHYIAPSVWAYKEKRAKKFAKVFDKLYCILPFEPNYFLKEGLEAIFVGHPLIGKQFSEQNFELNSKYKNHTKICFMPGSRVGEVKRLMPEMVKAIELLKQSIPNVVIIIPSFKHLKPIIIKNLKDTNIDYIIETNKDKTNAIYKICDLGLIKSGTSTIEANVASLPIITFYKVNMISALILKCLIKIRFANLINIYKNKEIIPEFIQGNFIAEKIAKKMYNMLRYKSNRQKQVKQVKIALEDFKNKDNLDPSEFLASEVYKHI